MLTHAGVTEAARLYAQRYGHEGMRSLLNLPINHVGGLVDLVAPALRTGGALVTMPGFDPARIPGLVREERVTLLGQVPAMHLAIDAVSPLDPAAFPDLRHLVWSGAAMPRTWIEDRIDGPAELSTCYGLTECTGSVTFTQPGASVTTLADTVGAPASPGVLRIDGPADEPGEVLVRGPLVMAGYLGRPEATAEAITPEGWLRTGDLGALDADGALRLVGRLKEMFKSGGYNVYPREVETALESHPAVAAAAVVAKRDPQWGEVGWAFVLARSPVTPVELADHARGRLANYKLPKRYVVTDDLPLLPIGKIDKRALATRVEEGADG
jgi:acyl-CoA synthetase (AMP-forming)/AMP-acid ligase II